MQITDRIVEGYSIKELVLLYRETFLHDYLLEHLSVATQNMESPETILAQITENEERLKLLNNTPLIEQVENYTTEYYKWREIAEKHHEDKKPMREKCESFIAELSKWEPISESSKYLKTSLISSIKCEAVYTFFDGVKDPVIFDPEWVSSQTEMKKKELAAGIENLAIKYQLAIEYQKEKDTIERELLKDLELLA